LSYNLLHKPQYFSLGVMNKTTGSKDPVPLQFGKTANFTDPNTGVTGQGELTQYKINADTKGWNDKKWEDVVEFEMDGEEPKRYSLLKLLE